MPSFLFNADVEVAPQRKAFHTSKPAKEAGQGYVKIMQAKPYDGVIIGEEGGEVHYPDGSMIRLKKGDAVVEGYDGVLRVIEAHIFAEHYVLVTGRKHKHPGDEYIVPEDSSAPDTALVVDAPLDETLLKTTRTDDELAREQARDEDPAAMPDPPTLLESALAKLEAQRSGDLTGAEKDALREHQIAEQEEYVARLKVIRDAALEGDLIDQKQYEQWGETGMTPEGVQVSEDPDGDGWIISRGTEEAETHPSGAEETVEDGVPAN